MNCAKALGITALYTAAMTNQGLNRAGMSCLNTAGMPGAAAGYVAGRAVGFIAGCFFKPTIALANKFRSESNQIKI